MGRRVKEKDLLKNDVFWRADLEGSRWLIYLAPECI